METVLFLMDNWETILLIATGIVTTASIVAKLTPSKVDDKIVEKLLDIINVLAINKPRDKSKNDTPDIS